MMINASIQFYVLLIFIDSVIAVGLNDCSRKFNTTPANFSYFHNKTVPYTGLCSFDIQVKEAQRVQLKLSEVGRDDTVMVFNSPDCVSNFSFSSAEHAVETLVSERNSFSVMYLTSALRESRIFGEFTEVNSSVQATPREPVLNCIIPCGGDVAVEAGVIRLADQLNATTKCTVCIWRIGADATAHGTLYNIVFNETKPDSVFWILEGPSCAGTVLLQKEKTYKSSNATTVSFVGPITVVFASFADTNPEDFSVNFTVHQGTISPAPAQSTTTSSSKEQSPSTSSMKELVTNAILTISLVIMSLILTNKL